MHVTHLSPWIQAYTERTVPTVKETSPRGQMPIPNRLTVSVAGNPLTHKEARYDTTALQAREGQYWYCKHFCLRKSLRDCSQLLLIVWGHILSNCRWYVLLVLNRRQVYVLMIGTCVLFLKHFGFVDCPIFRWGFIDVWSSRVQSHCSRCTKSWAVVHAHIKFIIILAAGKHASTRFSNNGAEEIYRYVWPFHSENKVEISSRGHLSVMTGRVALGPGARLGSTRYPSC